MKNRPRLRLLVTGFFIWLVPFLIAFAIFGIREANRPLFESIMPVVLTATVLAASLYHLANIEELSRRDGLLAGFTWFAMSVLLDIPMFFGGPIEISVAEYIADIGLTYFIIILIPAGLAAFSRRAGHR